MNENDTFLIRNKRERCVYWIVQTPNGREHMCEEELYERGLQNAPSTVRCVTCEGYWESEWQIRPNSTRSHGVQLLQVWIHPEWW